MLSDTDSLSIEIIGILLLIILHSYAVAMNTAFGTSSKNTEKYQATNRLVIALTSCLGAWLVFPHLELAIAFVVLLVVFGQYFPHKIALQHAEGIANRNERFVNSISIFAYFAKVSATSLIVTMEFLLEML